MHNRDKYKILAKKNQMMWPRYRKLRNKVTAELHRSVEVYYKGLVDETSHNPKYIWKTVNKVLNKDKATMAAKISWNSSVELPGNRYLTLHSRISHKQPPFPPETILRRRGNMSQEFGALGQLGSQFFFFS